MRILVIGAGIVGSNLAEELSQEGHEVAIIDRDTEKIKSISERMDILAISGEASRINILKSAGIKNCEMIIAVTNVDEVNIVICMLAAKFGVKNRIARIRNEDYTMPGHLLDLEGCYVSRIINPDKLVVDHIMQTLATPGANLAESLADGEILLRGFSVPDDAPVVGKTLMELKDIAAMDAFLIGGIYRNNKLIIPHGTDEIKSGDDIFVLVAKDTLALFLPLVNRRIWGMHRVIIYGCDPMAIELAKKFEGNIKEVVLLADCDERAEAASASLSKTIVLKGKGADINVLKDANINETDYFIALSNDDEDNLSSSLLAKKQGARHIITLTHDPKYISVLDSAGIDVVINPRLFTVGAITEYVRRGKIRRVVKLAESEAEVIEMIAVKNSRIITAPLKDMKFPKDALVGAVIKDTMPVIPRGNTIIKPGERVIIFTLSKAIKQVERLFEEIK